jgi:hypothetical protein
VTESIIAEFLMKYGEKAKVVLRSAYELMNEYRVSGKELAGHFDFRGLIEKLEEVGLRYNPSQLLRIMERDYGIIETSYRTATKRWYVFTDPDAVGRVLEKYVDFPEKMGLLKDPELEVLKLQIKVINIDALYAKARKLASKGFLNIVDEEMVRSIVFNELPLVAKVLKSVLKYEELFQDFISKAIAVIRLMDELATKSSKRAVKELYLNKEAKAGRAL